MEFDYDICILDRKVECQWKSWVTNKKHECRLDNHVFCLKLYGCYHKKAMILCEKEKEKNNKL